MDSCKIYLSSNLERFDLVQKINSIIEGEAGPFFSILKEGISFEIKENDEYDPLASFEFPDGFLFFKYTVDVSLEEINTDTKRETALNLISHLLLSMWKNQYPAVASCPFEDELPENGGYNSKNVPWPASYG